MAQHVDEQQQQRLSSSLSAESSLSSMPLDLTEPPSSYHKTPTSRPTRRVVFLGAPTLDRIDLADLLDLSALPLPPPTGIPSSAEPLAGPNWRILHRAPKRLKTNFTQNSYSAVLTPTSTATGTPASNHAMTSPERLHHSFLLSTTQPDPGPDIVRLGESFISEYTTDDDDDTSFLTGDFTDDDTSLPNPTQNPDRPPIPPLITLTDLEDLPSPSTIAVAPTNSLRLTSLVAILTISDQRTITTKFGRKAQVITLMVGDPTHAPFRVDMWLNPHPKTVDEMELKAVVRELRIQDIIVVKNLRLGMWKELVFGTTWRVGSSGGSAVWVVHRLRCEGPEERWRWRRRWDETLLSERKVARTVRWVQDFVGTGPGLSVGKILDEDGQELMPMDTPYVSFDGF